MDGLESTVIKQKHAYLTFFTTIKCFNV